MILQIQAYLQKHPGVTSREVARYLGVSERTVRRHRDLPEINVKFPTWKIPEVGLRVWVALEETGTLPGLMEITGASRATVYRGLRALDQAGLLVSFRSSTGARVYRQRECSMGLFDIFGEDQNFQEAEDPFKSEPKPKAKRPTVATTAERFSQWVQDNHPGVPGQTNRRALMGALSKYRKGQGISHYQETQAMERWFTTRPRPKAAAPLWRQFLASYPVMLEGIPSKPPQDLPPVRRSAELTDLSVQMAKAAKVIHEQTLEMARDLDRSLKDRDYPTWLSRYTAGRLYAQRVAKGQALADIWEPPLSAKNDGLACDPLNQRLSGQAQEGSTDPVEDLFEPEDFIFEEEDGQEGDHRGQVGPEDHPTVEV